MSANDIPAILPGQKWALVLDGPWGGHGNYSCTILDAREGWVRYAWYEGDDTRREEESFRKAFILVAGSNGHPAQIE